MWHFRRADVERRHKNVDFCGWSYMASRLPRRRPMPRFRFLPAVTLALALFVPSTTLACWDGFYAQVGNVNETGDDTTWDEATLQHHAKWLGRINALLPKNTTVFSDHGFVTLTIDGQDREFTWDDRHYRTLFDSVAHNVGASKIDRQRALLADTRIYVVQTGAFISESRARKLAEAISQDDNAEHGFFQAGGFPADNPEAHVVTSTTRRKLHRVYVGAFVNRGEAESLSKRLGRGAFVRELSNHH